MAKAIREKIRLNSTGKKQDGKPTGYFKTTTINKRLRAAEGKGKLQKKCYDPRAYNEATGRCGMHVEFIENNKFK